MEPVKVYVHLHRQKKKLDISGTQISIPNSSKKCNPTVLLQDEPGNIESVFERVKASEIFNRFSKGETSTILTMGANSTHVDNYKRLKLFVMTLQHLQQIISLDDPEYRTKLSIACIGLSDGRAVDMNNERTLDFDFLEEGLTESLYEPVRSLEPLMAKIKTGFSLPGLLISVRVEKVNVRASLLIDRAIESNTDVFHSLSKRYNKETRSIVSCFNLFDFGAVRFASDNSAPSMSQTALYFSQFIKYGDSKYHTNYQTILKDILKGDCLAVIDIEVREPNKEVEFVLEMCETLRHYKVSCGMNTMDPRVSVLYQLEEKFKQLTQQVESKTSENEVVLDLCRKMKDKIDGQREQIHKSNFMLKEENEKRLEIERDLMEAKNSICELTEQLEKAKDLLANEQLEKSDAVKELQRMNTAKEKQVEKLKVENERLKAIIDKNEVELSQLKEGEKMVLDEIQAMKRELDKIPDAKLSQKAVEKLKKSEENLKTELESLKPQLEEALEKIGSFEEERTLWSKAEEKLRQLEKEKRQWEKDEKKFAKVEQELRQLETKLQQLEEERENQRNNAEPVVSEEVDKKRPKPARVPKKKVVVDDFDEPESGPDMDLVDSLEMPPIEVIAKSQPKSPVSDDGDKFETEERALKPAVEKQTKPERQKKTGRKKLDKENMVQEEEEDVEVKQRSKKQKVKKPKAADTSFELPKRPANVESLLSSNAGFGGFAINPTALGVLKKTLFKK